MNAFTTPANKLPREKKKSNKKSKKLKQKKYLCLECVADFGNFSPVGVGYSQFVS